MCAKNWCHQRDKRNQEGTHFWKGTNKVLRMGVVPGRVWKGQGLRHGTNSKGSVEKTTRQRGRKEAFSHYFGNQQSGDRARVGVFSHALFSTISLDWAMEGRCERSTEKTGFGNPTSWKKVGLAGAVFCGVKDLGITVPKWRVSRLEDGRMLSMKRHCPEDVEHTLLKHAKETAWKRCEKNVKRMN